MYYLTHILFTAKVLPNFIYCLTSFYTFILIVSGTATSLTDTETETTTMTETGTTAGMTARSKTTVGAGTPETGVRGREIAIATTTTTRTGGDPRGSPNGSNRRRWLPGPYKTATIPRPTSSRDSRLTGTFIQCS